MALPEQIRKQTEAVQELYKQLSPEGEASGETAGTPTTGTPADTTSADDATVVKEATPAPATEQKAGGESAGEEGHADESYAQKYRTLQGMYNAEVPRLHQQNREMTQRVQQMEQLLASLSAQQTAAAPAAPTKILSDADVAEYGESIDVMRKVSREEVGAVMQRLDAMEQILRQMQVNVVPQVQAVAQRQQMSAEQQFWADLSQAVPSFRDINSSPDFQNWLLEADPLTGITRQTYLEDAQRVLDSRRVANFFRTWMEMNGQAAVAQSKGSASELEKQVAPGRAKSAGTPAANTGKTYSPKDIEKFFNDVRAGKYKGREQERDRIERDIFSAQRENRIVANT